MILPHLQGAQHPLSPSLLCLPGQLLLSLRALGVVPLVLTWTQASLSPHSLQAPATGDTDRAHRRLDDLCLPHHHGPGKHSPQLLLAKLCAAMLLPTPDLLGYDRDLSVHYG